MMGIAGTETKLVFLLPVGCENSRKNHILLRVQTQKKDDVMCYRLDRSLPLRGLMADFCARRGFPCDTVRFTHNGMRVPEAKSAEDLSMDNENVIDAWARARVVARDSVQFRDQ